MKFLQPLLSFFNLNKIPRYFQILGFSAEGLPVLPTTHFSADIDVIRREKMSWDEITKQSAKIVSFIGKEPILLPWWIVWVLKVSQILRGTSDT